MITADADGVSVDQDVTVIPNPTASLTLTASSRKARTGDVVRFEASARSSAGERLEDVPIAFALSSRPDPNRPESVGAGAPAQIDPLGRFVAEQSGVYTIVAMSGDRIARASVLVTPRNVAREIEFLGHATGLGSHHFGSLGLGRDRRDATTPSTARGTRKATRIFMTSPTPPT